MAEAPPGGLSLRLRLILSAAAAVAVAVILAAIGAFLTVRHELLHQVDVSLRNNAAALGPISPHDIENFRFQLGGVVQVIDANGTPVVPAGGVVPVTESDRAVANGQITSHFHDVTVQHLHIRIYTVGFVGGGAAELAAPLNAVDATLKRLVLLLTFLALGGIALAAALGTIVARAALVPVDRLTSAAERVAATMDLSAPIEVRGADEVARLGRALNTLLATVDQSQRAQRRLVADASHELRTPLTSLRTNLEFLARSPSVGEEERQAVLNDLVAQAAELSSLVGQLVDLEREPIGSEPPSRLAFDEVVANTLTRARLHGPGLRFTASLEPTTVMGQAGVLERAVANLLDNAAKWSPPGGEVEVNLVGGTLSVRDHGPGIDPADAAHVFERFYRSARARALPGSGLGLSIVRQAAEDHGGQAWILPAPGGGTVACLRIPTVDAPAPTATAVDAPQHAPPDTAPPDAVPDRTWPVPATPGGSGPGQDPD